MGFLSIHIFAGILLIAEERYCPIFQSKGKSFSICAVLQLIDECFLRGRKLARQFCEGKLYTSLKVDCNANLVI